MDNEEPTPDTERPRYLLPEGFGDIADYYRWIETKGQETEVPSNVNPPPMPDEVSLPVELSVEALASALNRKPFYIIQQLIKMKLFASPTTMLDHATAKKICAQLGVKCI